MPNWCYTNYTFYGEPEEVRLLHDKITEWTSNPAKQTDFGDFWLGNVLCGAGLEGKIDLPEEKGGLRCRGSISYLGDLEEYSDNESVFNMNVETAWEPMAKMWQAVIEALELKSVKFVFTAEEPGLDLYQIYNPDETDLVDYEYYIDSYTNEEPLDVEHFWGSIDCYVTGEDLLDILQDFLHSESNDLERLIADTEHYSFSSCNSFIRIHRFEKIKELYA